MGKDKEATKDCIFTALILLMEQKEYKYITITDIARKSGVSRMTYYRTYSSKEDILIQHFQKTAQAMVSNANGTAESALCSFFSYFLNHKKLTELIAQADLMKVLIECFLVLTDFLYHTCHPEAPHNSQKAYAMRFEAGGLFCILTQWLESGALESPEEMSEITLDIIRK